ncbi:MAG: hypothetical protein JWO67_3975 [Streptosporangiaceae bacterium]|nr:hypothetical protein [Streptosporangiaceae bacterium]
MSRRIVTAAPGQRLAIRVDANTLLAVPPMHPDLPSKVRVLIFEYVLRRQIGLAMDVAASENIRCGRYSYSDRGVATITALISERPHGTSRDHGVAA